MIVLPKPPHGYRVTEFRKPNDGEWFISVTANPNQAMRHDGSLSIGPRWILVPTGAATPEKGTPMPTDLPLLTIKKTIIDTEFTEDQIAPLKIVANSLTVRDTRCDNRVAEVRADYEFEGKALFVDEAYRPVIGKDSTDRTIIVFVKK